MIRVSTRLSTQTLLRLHSGGSPAHPTQKTRSSNTRAREASFRASKPNHPGKQKTCGHETDRSSKRAPSKRTLHRPVSHVEAILPLGAIISPRLLAGPGLLSDQTSHQKPYGSRSCFQGSRKHPASERERPCSRLEFAVPIEQNVGNSHIKYPDLKSTTPTHPSSCPARRLCQRRPVRASASAQPVPFLPLGCCTM